VTDLRIVRILLIGAGNLGRRFARVVADKRAEFMRRYALDLRLVGIADSRGAAIDPEGLDGRAIESIKLAGGTVADLPEVGRPGMTGLELIESVEADLLCQAGPVNLDDAGEPGLSHVRQALENGLHVSTPNKGPIVLAYRELQELAVKNGVQLRFDGTVAGGLPAIALGARDLRGATIERIDAVPNLTTGYVLDLLAAGADWPEAIRKATEAGALEGDGAWDLDGWDAVAKLAILAQAVLGADVDVRSLPRKGIRDVDLEALRASDGPMRLLATAIRQPDASYRLNVAPVELAPDHPLAGLGSQEMGITYYTDLFGTITSIIDERTPLPSASTMLRDILDIYRAE